MGEEDYKRGLEGGSEPWTFLGTPDEDLRDWEAGRRQRLVNEDLANRIRDGEEESLLSAAPYSGPPLSYKADKFLADTVLAVGFGLMAGVPTFVVTIIVGFVIGIPVFHIPCLFLFAPAIIAGGVAAFITFNKRRHEY